MRSRQGQQVTILMAEDDDDDRDLVRDAVEGASLGRLRSVSDGQELFDYLRRDGEYASDRDAPRPGVILLDLNLPRKDGRQVLAELKADPEFRQIPVIVLTASADVTDVDRAYNLGASSYIAKPVTRGALLRVLETLAAYWRLVELPQSA